MIAVRRGRLSFAFSLFMLSAASLCMSPVQAQQETRFSSGLNTGYLFPYYVDSGDGAPLAGLYIQVQEGHWALQAELDCFLKGALFLPFVNLVYRLRPSDEARFTPYVSIGIGGRGESGAYFAVLSRLGLGMRHRIMRVQGGAFVLNVSLTSLQAFPFSPFAFGPNVGLEFVFR